MQEFNITKFNSGIVAFKVVEENSEMAEILHFCGFQKDSVEEQDFISLNEELLEDPEFGLTSGDFLLAEATQELLDHYNKEVFTKNSPESLTTTNETDEVIT